MNLIPNFTKEDKNLNFKTRPMKRTEIPCPDCMKKKLLTSNDYNARCDNCGNEFIITGASSVRYKKAGDIEKPDPPYVPPAMEIKPLKKFYCVVMSEDVYPDGSNEEDPHQKYGVDIEAEDKVDAERKVRAQFAEDDLPVHWVEVHNG